MEVVVWFINDKPIQQNLHYPKDDIVLLDPTDDDDIDSSEDENEELLQNDSDYEESDSEETDSEDE